MLKTLALTLFTQLTLGVFMLTQIAYCWVTIEIQQMKNQGLITEAEWSQLESKWHRRQDANGKAYAHQKTRNEALAIARSRQGELMSNEAWGSAVSGSAGGPADYESPDAPTETVNAPLAVPPKSLTANG